MAISECRSSRLEAIMKLCAVPNPGARGACDQKACCFFFNKLVDDYWGFKSVISHSLSI
jgi:hypothetical protein